MIPQGLLCVATWFARRQGHRLRLAVTILLIVVVIVFISLNRIFDTLVLVLLGLLVLGWNFQGRAVCAETWNFDLMLLPAALTCTGVRHGQSLAGMRRRVLVFLIIFIGFQSFIIWILFVLCFRDRRILIIALVREDITVLARAYRPSFRTRILMYACLRFGYLLFAIEASNLIRASLHSLWLKCL